MKDRARRPPQFPPAFATAWGDDVYGLWAELEIPGSNSAEPVVQRLRWIEPGNFLMGSPESERERLQREGPQHLVQISQGFWLADTACTLALWHAVMGSKPSPTADGDQQPVGQVNWNEVKNFLRKLEEIDPGYRVTLPTEAQWEYACRAGTITPFSFGENVTPELVNYYGDHSYAGANKAEHRKKKMALVKSLPPNPWGIFEMHGNVWEWCADGLREYTQEVATDPVGPLQYRTHRAVRGGSWGDLVGLARSAFRNDLEPDRRFEDLGFRLCSGP